MTDTVTDPGLTEPNSAALSPAQARERQARNHADPTWCAAYLSGSGPHREEADTLQRRISQGDEIDDLVANAGAAGAKVPRPGGPNIAGVSAYDVATAVGWDKQIGVHNEFTSRLLKGEKLPDEEYGGYRTGFRDKFGDPAWVAAAMTGKGVAYRELINWMHLVAAQKGRHAPTIMGYW